MFWRSIIGLVIVFCIGIKRKRLVSSFKELSKQALFWLILRGIIGGITMFCFFTALGMGDIGEIGALLKISPIFAVVLAYLILKEGFNLKICIAIILAISGVFLIRNPFVAKFDIAHILVLIAALGTGFITINVRKLKIYGLDSWMVVMSLLVCSLLISLPRVIVDIKVYSMNTFLLVIGVGIMSTLAQLLTTAAAKYIEAKMSSILTLLSVFEFMIVGILVFGEVITQNKFAGAMLIIVSAVMTIMFSRIKKNTTT